MIPILYEKTETAFVSNGIGRLRDAISCIVTEERNGIYECDFEYPIDGANYELIQVGRIVGVTHDESGDIQPFDIVSFTKPIDGVVTFHCVHISYRQSYMTVTGTGINSLSAAFSRLQNNTTPSNPFTYWTDKTSTGYWGCMDGTPRSVRESLGGIEGSLLDAYGGEFEWDKWMVKLWSARGQYRDFSIRYGVNLLDYNEEYDSSGCYSSCIPYWTDGETKIVGDKQTNGGVTPSGRDQCIPLDVSDKFEDQPSKAQVNSMGASVMNAQNPTVPAQSIEVSFVRLQDMGEFADFQNLLQCKLCDTINVIFPDFNSSGQFKIVKTVWNVLTSKYDEMELGELSVTLSEALGISNTLDRSGSGSSVLDFYPVGSYYETSNTLFDPNVAWGGTWVLETAGLVHVSAGTGYTIGDSGGEATHVLTSDEMPSHEGHLYSNTGSVTGSGNASGKYLQTMATYGTSPRGWRDIGNEYFPMGYSRGSGTAHNNMQPYVVVNRWHRTA